MKFRIFVNGKNMTRKVSEYFRTTAEIYVLAVIISQVNRWAYLHHIVAGKPMPYYRGTWFAVAIVLGSAFIYTFVITRRNKAKEIKEEEKL